LGPSLGLADASWGTEKRLQHHVHLDQKANLAQVGLAGRKLPKGDAAAIESGQVDNAEDHQLRHLDARVQQLHGIAAVIKGTASVNGPARELRNWEDVAHKLAETHHNLQQLGEEHVHVAHKVAIVEVDKLRTVQGQRANAVDDDLDGVGNKVGQRRQGTTKVWLGELR